MKIIYTANATVISGRDGHAKTDDNRLSLELSSPGNSDKSSKNSTGTNPEQLFACGYGACFGSVITSLAKKKNIVLTEVEVQAEVSLNEDNNEYFLSVVLHAILPGVEQSLAKSLVKDAHQICPYSKATRNNIEVTLKVNNEVLSSL